MTLPRSLKILVVFGLVFSSVCNAGEDADLLGSLAENAPLKRSAIVFRHGDRAPLVPVPDDANNCVWKYGFGELTDRGRQRMYKFGQYIREAYGSWLTNDPAEVFARSSPASR